MTQPLARHPGIDREPAIAMMSLMQCTSCGGRLIGRMTVCHYCGTRQDIDLRQIHFHDLGTDASLPCPSCAEALSVIEFETEPALRIERCNACHGMFFNPGELEALLDAQTNPLVWLDPAQMNQVSEDYGFHHEVVYRKCPVCADRMSHINFAGHSGVILDRCGTHGVWLEGGELRRLAEWWRTGGKLVFQQHEADKARRLYQAMTPKAGKSRRPEPSVWTSDVSPSLGGGWFDGTDLLSAAVKIVASLITH